MSAQPVVEVQDLHKRFDTLEVLKGLNFRVAPGEIICVWGPSGAGKSTLLHVLGLMTPPSEGKLNLFGQDMARPADSALSKIRNERIGFLFQFHYLLPDLSLLENVMIPLLIRGEPRESAEGKAKKILERLGLGPRLHHRPAQSSGGEQQRTALARALVGEPALLLADEPTGNLDRGIGREVEKLLKSEVKSRGTTLVLVTHDETLAAEADRRLVLIDGVLNAG
ncbi:MAG TPA: ABC transporter ATP-binding protein [Elusimicrobiota bacterium]|nr:ABC transporter ATP-binding protein [Elusimicrobiota bacterium]